MLGEEKVPNIPMPERDWSFTPKKIDPLLNDNVVLREILKELKSIHEELKWRVFAKDIIKQSTKFEKCSCGCDRFYKEKEYADVDDLYEDDPTSIDDLPF